MRPFFLLFALLVALPAFAATIAYTPSIADGFSAQKTDRTYGYILSLTVGGKALPADLQVTTPTGKASAVGVLSEVEWAGGAADTLRLNASVSSANRQTLQALSAKLATPAVLVQFAVYSYDAPSQKWFTAFQNVTSPLSASITRGGKGFLMTVGTTAGTEVPSPQNYPFSLTLSPGSLQTLRYANSPGVSVDKSWGIAAP